MIAKFRKKPVVIEAVRFDGENVDEIDAFTSGSFFDDAGVKFVRTLEGDMQTPVGHWVIKGVAGEFYPCDPAIFEQTYEKVAEASA